MFSKRVYNPCFRGGTFHVFADYTQLLEYQRITILEYTNILGRSLVYGNISKC